jgi:hypothetical protein
MTAAPQRVGAPLLMGDGQLFRRAEGYQTLIGGPVGWAAMEPPKIDMTPGPIADPFWYAKASSRTSDC